MQVSRLDVVYDTSKPERERLVSLKFNGVEVADDDVLEVAVPQIIARGGDHYDEFLVTKQLRVSRPLGELTTEYFRRHKVIPTPAAGRQRDLGAAAP